MAMVPDVTETDFEREIGLQSGLVLIDLWAPWCSPCRAMSPVLDDLAEDFAGDVVIRKINIEVEQALSDRLAVTAVPTLILYRDGAELDRVTGMQSRARLSAWLEAHL